MSRLAAILRIRMSTSHVQQPYVIRMARGKHDSGRCWSPRKHVGPTLGTRFV